MKWQQLVYALAGAVLLASAGCSAPPPAPTDTLTAPAAATETQVPTEPASPTPESPPSDAQPAAPAHYQAGDSIQLDEIQMLNPIEGWAVSGPYVLLTVDGGNTWHEATPPETLPAAAAAKAHGAFLDAHTAWVIFSIGDQIAPEAAVWHTVDGGGTWTQSAALFHEAFGDRVWAEFVVLDAENVWLMVRGVYSAAGRHFTAHLFRTTDAGAAWIPLVGDADASWVDVTGMAFSYPANGWVTWQTTGAYAPSPPAYAVTGDGGASWESRELPPPPDAPDLFERHEYCEPFQPTLLSTSSIRMLVGCFDFFDPPEEYASYLYATEDGGSTWETTLLPEPVLAAQSTLIYFDADRALLLGRDMYGSADGGRTWDFVKTVNWDGQFSFIDPQQGWAIASSSAGVALVNTVNGGGTWAVIKPVIGQ